MKETAPTRDRYTPLYARIKQEIADQITSKTLSPGEVLPTRVELAAKYSTAVATVDRALQELAREGLIEAGSGRRTVVAEQVQPTISSIAVVWDWPRSQEEASADFLNPLFSGIRQACGEFMLEVHYRASANYHEVLEQTCADGLLVIRPEYSDAPRLKQLHSEGIPVVGVPGILDDEGIPTIASDNFQGMEQAVAHLTSLGHKNIGFVSLTATMPDHFERLQGFLNAMAQCGLTVNPHWVHLLHESQPSQFAQRLESWLSPNDLPTALIVGDFLMYLALLRRLNTLGLRVPDDISLVCFDDPPAAAHLDPAVTAVRQHLPKLGYRAVERLMETTGGKVVPQTDRIATNLIIRESTDRPHCSA